MRIKRIMTPISGAAWPDPAGDRLAYWLARPPRERVEAAREFCRASFLRLHRPWPARIAKICRPFPSET